MRSALLTFLATLLCAAAHAEPVKLSGSMVTGGSVGTFGVPLATTDQQAVFIADRVTDNRPQLWANSFLSGGLAPGDRTGTALLAGESVDAFDFTSATSFYIYYTAIRASTRELWWVQITGGTPVKMSGSLVAGGNVISFSPDSTTAVLYLAEKDQVGVRELYRALPNGTGSSFGEGKMSGTLVAGGDVKLYASSSSGSLIAFVANKTTAATDELFVTNIAFPGTQTNVSGTLTPGGNVQSFRWNADGSRLVFLADKDVDARNELYSVTPSGSSLVKLSGSMAPTGNVKSYALSSDGATVVFIADRETPGIDELYSVPITGGTPVKLNATLVSGGDVTSFLIAENSQRVVFAADGETDNLLELFSVPIAGGAATKLSGTMQPQGSVISYRISADSSRVTLLADREVDNRFELYSVPLAGGSLVKLSGNQPEFGFISSHAISPDSRRVVCIAGGRLYSVPLAGGSLSRISGEMASGAQVAAFAISADSLTVVFRGDKHTNGVQDLFATAIDGGGALLDIDGDGLVLPTTDGLMLMRWQLGIRGNALFGGISFAPAATRTTVATIEAQLRKAAEAVN